MEATDAVVQWFNARTKSIDFKSYDAWYETVVKTIAMAVLFVAFVAAYAFCKAGVLIETGWNKLMLATVRRNEYKRAAREFDEFRLSTMQAKVDIDQLVNQAVADMTETQRENIIKYWGM